MGEEEVQAAGVVEVQMADDDFADVGVTVPRCFDGRGELVFGLIFDTREDVCDLGAPD